MKKIAAIFALATGMVISSTHAVTLVGYDLLGSTANTNIPAGAVATGVLGGNMSNNVGLTASTASSARWAFSQFNQVNTDEAAFTNALVGNDSVAFSLSAASGYSLTIRGVGPFSLYRSGSGPKNIALVFSTDSSFSTYSIVATNANTGTNAVTTDFSTVAAWTNFAAPITVAEGTTGYFRIVGYGASGTGGTMGIISGGTVDFSLIGDVNSLGMYTWTGGVGSWAPGVAANWQSGGASANWVNGKDVTFGSGGELAIDAAGVSAGIVALSGTTPLNLTGGALAASSVSAAANSALNLNGGAVTVTGNVDLTDATISGGNLSFGGILGANISTGTTTISTALGGNGSLSKSGAGELILSRTNSHTGTTAVGGGTLTTGASEILFDAATLQISANATFKLGGNETVGGLNAIFGSFINLQGNTLTAGGNNSSFTNGATITGTGGLVKNGTGQMYFNNNTNTFSGGFVLNSGEVAYTSSGAAGSGVISNTVFGTGTVTLNGGSFGSSSSSSGRNLHNSVILNGNIQFGQTAWGSSTTNLNGGTPNLTVTTNGAGITTLAGNSTINTIGSVQWDQNINGNFRLTKTGTGAVGLSNNYLTLRASNNIAGVTVLSGSLGYKNRNALGTGTLILADGVVVGQEGVINNPVVGTDSVDRSIPNDVRLDGNVTFGLGATASYLGGNIDLNGANRTVTLGNTTYMFGQITNGGLVVDGGAGSGTRSLFLNGNNTFSSGTVVRTNVNLGLGSDNAIGSGSLVFTNNAGVAGQSSILRAVPLTTNTPQVRTLTNNVVLDTGMNVVLDSLSSVVVASNTNTVLIDLTLAGNISGAGGLTKSNNNTVTLSGQNSYSGPTTVVNGSLVVITNNISATFTTNTVQITFSNTPANGTYAILPGALTGSYTATYSNLSSTQQATFSSAAPASVTVSTLPVKQDQTITFGSLAAVKVGNSPIMLNATASSGLSVSYVSSDPTVASILGNTVTILKAGTTTITASQPGNADYNAAPSLGQMLTVNPGDQSISFGALAAVKVGDSPITLNATASSGLSVSYVSSDPTVASILGNTVTILKAGTTTITASQAGDPNYNAASSVGQILTVNPASGISDWLGGAATNSENVGKYLIGGATNMDAASERPVVINTNSTNLVLSAIVRTNDTKGEVQAQWVTNVSGFSVLPAGSNEVTGTRSPDQSGVDATQFERREFSVPRTNGTDRLFLRLKATLQP